MSEHPPTDPKIDAATEARNAADPEARLSHALGSLPRVGARSGFTRRLLARLPEVPGDQAPAAGFDLRWALAAALAFAVAVVFVAGERMDRGGPPEDPAELQARIEALRREQRAIAAELEHLETLAEDKLEPVLVISAEGDHDLLVDLSLTTDKTNHDPEGVPR